MPLVSMRQLLDHAADLRSEPLPREVATVIDYYLAVEASPREAIDRIAMIGKGAGIDLGPALYVMSRRFDLLEERAAETRGESPEHPAWPGEARPSVCEPGCCPNLRAAKPALCGRD